MVNGVSSRISKLYNVDDNHKANALIKPVKWCGRSVVNIGKSNAGNIIKRVAAAFAGVILFIPCGLLSLVGIAAKAISPSKVSKTDLSGASVDPKTGFRVTNPKAVGALYEICQVMDKLFEKHGIKYWIIFGTLLGHERHGSVIPWDDDMDIQIMPESLDKLKSDAFKADLKKYQLELLYNPDHDDFKICPNDALLKTLQEKLGIGVKHKNMGKQKNLVWNWPFIDIFASEYKDGKKTEVDFVSKYAKKTWPNTGRWKVNDLLKNGKFKRVQFGPIKTNVPYSGIEQNMVYNYGNDWNKVAYQMWDHENEVGHKESKKVKVTEFEAAKYESKGIITKLQK